MSSGAPEFRDERRLVAAILDFLLSVRVPPSADPESVSIAIDCLATAFDVDPTRDDICTKFGIQPGLLRRALANLPAAPSTGIGTTAVSGDSFGRHAPAQGPEPGGDGVGTPMEVSAADSGVVDGTPKGTSPVDPPLTDRGKQGAAEPRGEAPTPAGTAAGQRGPTPAPAGPSSSSSHGPGGGASSGGASSGCLDPSSQLELFLSGLEANNFYQGTTPGSWEYLERQRQARSIFDQCIQQQEERQEKSQQNEVHGVPSAEAAGSEGQHRELPRTLQQEAGRDKSAATAGTSGLDTDEAEKNKTEGNVAYQEKRYSDAAALYTEAISRNDKNAIYWANRAAALCQLGNYNQALFDCQQAIKLDPTYSKAYRRLGDAYMGLQQYKEAIDLGYKKALELDSNNDAIKESMKAAKRKLDEQRQRHNPSGEGTSSFTFSFPTGQSLFGSPPGPSPSAAGGIPGVSPGFSLSAGQGPHGVGQASFTFNGGEGGIPLPPQQLMGLLGMFGGGMPMNQN